jgi:hypothetical protein
MRTTLQKVEGFGLLIAGTGFAAWGLLGDAIKGPNPVALIAGGVFVVLGIVTLEQRRT